MSLTIDFKLSQIGINSEIGNFNIQNPSPRVDIQSRQPRLELDIQQPSVVLDQSAPKEEIGVKNPMGLAYEYAGKGRQAAARGTARIVREGEQLRDHHKGGSVEQIAKGKKFNKERGYNVELMPKSMVKVDLHRGRTDVNLQAGEVTVSANNQPLNMQFQRGNHQTYLLEKGYFEVNYTGARLNRLIG
ncbi:DUF6470 family protein [Isachenkonia alkalipeptolytica]|uniref:Uncharacterized protein n=1 Tax=Isachenkonia alkalipeptolytica TaxID=2565777 RepID=A0AA44BDU4_9CLOT|nr:DUF6470 family protein [Isachenkonia alkalipeptolytica]NBG88303.1 hypothetical protein [Isachenkonia alkalipeptolytica]